MPSGLLRKFTYWVPALIYMGAIFYLSSSRAPEFFDYINYRFFFIKFLHLVEYGVLGALYYYALRKTSSYSHAGALWVAVVLAGAFGLSDEWHQSFIAGRIAMPSSSR